MVYEESERRYQVKLRQPIPVRPCEVFPSLQKKQDGTNPLYNNYMFGAASGKKMKLNKKEKKRKNRQGHHNQSVECIGRSYNNKNINNYYNKVNNQQQSSQFLPEDIKNTQSHKSGSQVRIKKRKDEELTGGNSGLTGINGGRRIQTQEDTLSDEKFSQAISGSEKESKDYQSQSSHSRKNLTYRKSNYTFGGGDRNIENLESLRNLCKAEKELRGIFQAVKQYEFPIIKDAEGNIKQIGKLQPLQKVTKIPPIRPQNPIVFDKAFRRQFEQLDSVYLETITADPKTDESKLQGSSNLDNFCIPSLNNAYQSLYPQTDNNNSGRGVQPKLSKQWETSTIASSTFYSDNNNNNNLNDLANINVNRKFTNQLTLTKQPNSYIDNQTNLNEELSKLQLQAINSNELYDDKDF